MTKDQTNFSDSIFQLNILGKIDVEILKEQKGLSIERKQSRGSNIIKNHVPMRSFSMGLATRFSLTKTYDKVINIFKINILRIENAVLINLDQYGLIRFKSPQVLCLFHE